MTMFSIIVATRNRPALFQQALESLLRQSYDAVEIIVVDDGSDEASRAEYRKIIDAAGGSLQFHSLVCRPNGHGPGYARNFGANAAMGDYLCFLDDDDSWTDDLYLARAQAVITEQDGVPDLIFSSQAAFLGDQRKEGPIWLEGLAAEFERATRPIEAGGFYRVAIEDLLRAGGLCHLNTMIVRRALFDEVGGFDENIRWEEDRDLFLRLIDKASVMLLSPAIVARHNIPDPARTSNATTMLDELRRRLFQLRVFDKACLFASHPAIRAHGRVHKSYTLKRIVQALVVQGDSRMAAFYARQALGAAPTLKWAGYTGWISLKSLGGG